MSQGCSERKSYNHWSVTQGVYLWEPGLIIQYAKDAMWPRGNQFQTTVEILE